MIRRLKGLRTRTKAVLCATITLFVLGIVAPATTLAASPTIRVAQEVPLPDNIEQLVAAFLTISAGVATVIGLTGFGKWLAKISGREIGGNQVRAVLGVAAVGTSVVYASLCACAGVVAFPVGGDQGEMLRWLWASSGTLILLSMAVWKKFVRQDPPVIELPAVLSSTL